MIGNLEFYIQTPEERRAEEALYFAARRLAKRHASMLGDSLPSDKVIVAVATKGKPHKDAVFRVFEHPCDDGESEFLAMQETLHGICPDADGLTILHFDPPWGSDCAIRCDGWTVFSSTWRRADAQEASDAE
jgi:hypothetical protein